jgi:hypothetical protein
MHKYVRKYSETIKRAYWIELNSKMFFSDNQEIPDSKVFLSS